MRKTGLALIVFCAICAAQRKWGVEDLWDWHTLGDPRIRADGQWVVYVEGGKARPNYVVWSNLWAVSADGKKSVRVTDGAWNDFSPRWSPDGTRIAWIRVSGGETTLRVAGLETLQDAVIARGDITRFSWSPDGKWIAYGERVTEDGEVAAWLVFDIPRSWVPLPARRLITRLVVLPCVEGPVPYISESDFDAAGEPAWMPDGRSIVIAGADGALYAINLADRKRRRLTAGSNRNESPVVAPDGSKIAYLSTDSRPASYSVRRLFVMSSDGTRTRELAGALDRDVTAPQWSSDSRTVYFVADDRGSTHVYAARNDGSVRQVTRTPERLDGLSLADNGRAATVRFTPSRAPEVITMAVDTTPEPLAVASPDEKLRAERETGSAEKLEFASDGKTVQAWVIRPPGFDASKKYPLLLDILDAPRRMCTGELSPDSQIYAAAGYVVLCVNARGTPGYGEEFGRLLPTRLPGDDADDLVRGVDAMVAKGFVDPRRMALRGGLVAAWILGHTTRFAAAVVRCPIMDWRLESLSSPESLARVSALLGAMPWEDPDRYLKQSPLSFAQNIGTPTLVLARDGDAQSQALYGVLTARKVDSVLVRLPDSEIAQVQIELAWLRRYLK